MPALLQEVLELLRKELPQGTREDTWYKVSLLPLPGPLRVRVLEHLEDVKLYTPLVTPRGRRNPLTGITPYKPRSMLLRKRYNKGTCKCGAPTPHRDHRVRARHMRWMRAVRANRLRWARVPDREGRRLATRAATRARLAKQHDAWLSLVHPHVLKTLGREYVIGRLTTNLRERRRLRRRLGFNA